MSGEGGEERTGGTPGTGGVGQDADTDGGWASGDHSGYYLRITDLADEARHARETFEPPDERDPERALACARDGLGSVVALYVEARTAEWEVRFSQRELDLLHLATNDWLEQYAGCYGVDIDAEFTVREAAELLLKTHNIRDVAALMTQVPGRDG